MRAAIGIAEADGYAAVSMNRIAKELGTSPMALYRYVDAKSELIPLMLDAAIGEPPDPVTHEGWRAAMSHWCWDYLAVLRRNPWTLRVPIVEAPNTPNQIAWLERALTALRDTTLTENEKVSVVMLLGGYVRSTEAMFHGIAEAVAAASSSAEEMMSSYSDVLRQVIDAERFPSVATALREGVFDQPDSVDGEFAFGLDRILDGVEALERGRTA